MPSVIHAVRSVAVVTLMMLASCKLDTNVAATGPTAAVKLINLLQGAENASIGFETGRPLSVIGFPSIAPTEASSYFFVTAGAPRQLRVLLTSATVLDSTVTFAANQYYTIVTTGLRTARDAAAPSYLILQNNMSAVTTGNVRFRFVHGATATARVDVHVAADSATFDATSLLFANVPYRGTATVESRIAGNRKICVIVTGVLPSPAGSNCASLRRFGVASGVVVTVALRDPAGTETTPGVLLTLDRTP